MVVRNTCVTAHNAGVKPGDVDFGPWECNRQQKDCLASCPGATED